MWDDNPATSKKHGLTRGLHVGKVWRDRTDVVSGSARSTADDVAVGVPPYSAPLGGTAVRLPRPVTASVVASALLVAGPVGCTSDDDPAGGRDIVIGADLNNDSPVDIAYARALQLRVEQINAGGELGGRQLILRTQDNRSDPTASLRNVSTFADDAQVAAII